MGSNPSASAKVKYMSENNSPTKKLIRPGVKALIVHEGKILMIHERVRKGEKIVNITDFPGGGIDFAEDLKTALIREVKEEVGLNIKVGNVVGAWDFVLGELEHTVPGKSGVHIVCIGYQCSLISETVIDVTHNPAPEDIFDAKWYTREELLEDEEKLSKHQGMIDAVKRLDI